MRTTSKRSRTCGDANRCADESLALLSAGRYGEVAARAVCLEQRSRYSMIFSFEKMALRDAMKSEHGIHVCGGTVRFLPTRNLSMKVEHHACSGAC